MGTNDKGRLGAGHFARRRGVRPLATIAVVAAMTAAALSGCASAKAATAKPAVEDSYGGLPSFLPSDATQPDSVLIGTADRPALTVQGDSVKVNLGTATVLATVTGPEVPGEGLPYETPSTTCTWTVTLTDATADVPITISDFTTLDHLGAVYKTALVSGQPVPPRVLAPGKTVTFELRAVMTVGEGLMRWAPDGTNTLASWDFEVETD